MWKIIKNDQNNEIFMFNCIHDKNKNEFKFFITNLKEIWYEYCSLDIILERSKNLNKRIEYDNDTIINTITNDMPSQYTFEDVMMTRIDKILHFKYSVGDRPFKMYWEIKNCTKDEYLNILVHPLIMSVNCLSKQNDELKTIIHKKDVEIEQYKQEGAILRRTKIATEPFQNEYFDAKYSIEDVKNAIQLASINDNGDLLKIIAENEKKIVKNPSSSSLSSSLNSTNLMKNLNGQKNSPKKKRNYARLQQAQLRQKMKIEKKATTYDDSDSCTPPMALEDNLTLNTSEMNHNGEQIMSEEDLPDSKMNEKKQPSPEKCDKMKNKKQQPKNLRKRLKL